MENTAQPVAVVTGASRGIGAEVAKLLAANGYSVAVNYVNDKAAAIVNISSLAARTGGAGEWVPYAASKGAVNSFTIGLAREVATEGIRGNAVAPGLVETGLRAANGEPGRLARLSPTIPMQRAGTPDEIAQDVLWLLSEAASYTTGTILEIGGGR